MMVAVESAASYPHQRQNVYAPILRVLCAFAVATNPLAAAFDEMNYFLWVDQYYKREQHEVEASALYPEVEVVTIEQYMSSMIKAAQ